MITESSKRTRYWAVVPAAGTGKRMNVDIPKQYLEICGKPLIEHTIQRLLEFPLLEKIVVVLCQGDEECNRVSTLRRDRIMLAEGGPERYLSVLNGIGALLELADPDDWVMIHDVARPCVRHSDLKWLVDQLDDHPVGGLLGSPVLDTVKRTSETGGVVQTVSRELLWHALTPQMFRIQRLYDALLRVVEDGVSVTDEASAMEYAGHQPLMVEGHGDNIKVTRSSDLALAELYIKRQLKLFEVS